MRRNHEGAHGGLDIIELGTDLPPDGKNGLTFTGQGDKLLSIK